MDKNIRPSGLTAFAIINFIFAGVIGMSILFSLGLLASAGGTGGFAWVILVLNTAVMALLIVSGIGYLQCHPLLGRLFGSVYALLDIAKTCVMLLHAAAFAQSAVLFVGNSVWPLLTLIFINIVFGDVWQKRTRLAELAGKGSSKAAAEREMGALPLKKNPPHLVLIMMQSIRQTLRGVQGVLFPLITLVACFLAIGIIVSIAQGVQNLAETRGGMDRSQSEQMMRDVVIKQAAYGFFVWLFDEPSSNGLENGPAKTITLDQGRHVWADYVTSEKPALLSLIFAVMMTLFPMLCALLAFNQISEDARRKGFRYLLLRTTRASIYFGKLLASLVVIIPIIIITVSAVAFFISISYSYYPVAEVVSWSLWAVVMLILVSAPSIAFCLFLSTLINSGFGSLAAGTLTLGFWPLIARLLKDAAGPLVFLQYLLPQKAAYFLMHPQWWVVLLAVAGCCLYTAAYAGGGYFYFKRKSL